jgi:hypothetical protein
MLRSPEFAFAEGADDLHGRLQPNPSVGRQRVMG